MLGFDDEEKPVVEDEGLLEERRGIRVISIYGNFKGYLEVLDLVCSSGSFAVYGKRTLGPCIKRMSSRTDSVVLDDYAGHLALRLLSAASRFLSTHLIGR